MIIEIAGKRVQVDDSFKDLSPEDQQAQVDLIANRIASGEGESASEYDTSKPVAGAVIGATTGAMFGPAVGSVVDATAEKIAQKTIGPDQAKNRAISNWLKTQTTGPDVGGATYKDAFKKSETARGVPIQSRGSQIPIRKGFLGIENQPTPPSLPQKTAANILEGERLNKPGIPRRVAGMGVAGAETGKMISDLEQGNMFDAAVSGLGTAGGLMSQSRIKPVRAIGTGLSMLVPMFQGGKEAKELIYPNQPKDEEVQKKADGGSVTSPKLKSLSDFLDQLMQQATAPAPAPAPAAPQGGMPPGMPPQGGMPPGMPGVPPQQPPMQQPPMQQPPTQQSPLNAMMPQMAGGGKVGALGSIAKKLHEVLTPYEGKTLLATLADRTKATDGFKGGPGFINLHPDYTWAVDAPAVGKKHMEAVERFGGPNQTVMVPMLMSKEAHKSNRPVFEKIYGDVLSKIKSGELSPEEIAAINQRIAIEKKADLSKNPGIESPDFLEFANAFNRRGALADIFGLKKLGATDLQKHLDETIDPALKEASTGSVGPQLFTMSGYENAPGIHGGYNIGFRGEKGADQFIPAEREFVFRDLEKQAMEQMGRPMTDYNYRNILKEHGGLPNQFIDERLLRGLQEVGRKKGGLV